MTITILDGHALNPGDLDWDGIKQFGSLSVYDRTPPELVIERIGNSECILLNKVNITREIIRKCPNLRYIGVLATGYNVVDTKACRDNNITVTNIPSYSTDAVAQYVFACILEFTNQIQTHAQSVFQGDWITCPDFCYWLSPLTELSGKTLGIYGFGHIGQQVAKIAHAFNMNVLVNVHRESSYSGNETKVSFQTLLTDSDFLTLHTPQTPETTKIINNTTLAKMKRTAILINAARGGLVDELALKQALESGLIAGYAADVVQTEPMVSDCPLLNAPHCLITPHIAWAPRETRRRLLSIAERNIELFLSGTPQNVVN